MTHETHLRSLKGMHDLGPTETPAWQQLESLLRQLAAAYGYDEVRPTLLERTELFKRSIGDVTDIVAKEMYSFLDRDGESLSLRPEATASCVRALIQHQWLDGVGTARLWYLGPMFRHENPQKGRFRQFHQFGLEAYGWTSPDIELEQLALTARLWRALGLQDQVTLELNSLGNAEERAAYRTALVAYLHTRQADLDADSQRRLATNPLRILDSKHPGTQAVLAQAPTLTAYLGSDSQAHLAQLGAGLQRLGLAFVINPRLVRGLDYYNQTVFEWTTTALGAQATVCAGGRYDGLVAQLGGPPTPAVGFAIGLERLLLLWQQVTPPALAQPQVYFISQGTLAQQAALGLAEQLREALPGLRLLQHLGGGSFKSQFKRADKSGAEYALILGDDECQQGKLAVRPLRVAGEQQLLTVAEVVALLRQKLAVA